MLIYINSILESGPVLASRGRYCAGRSRYVPARAGQGRSRPVGAWAGSGTCRPVPEPAVWCLSLPEPLKDRKKRCIIIFLIDSRNDFCDCEIQQLINFPRKRTRKKIFKTSTVLLVHRSICESFTFSSTDFIKVLSFRPSNFLKKKYKCHFTAEV